jgi:hypothetical protein
VAPPLDEQTLIETLGICTTPTDQELLGYDKGLTLGNEHDDDVEGDKGVGFL